MNRLEKAAAFGAMMGKRAVALNPMVLSSLAGAAIGGGGTAIYDWLKGTKENKLRRAMIGAGVGGLAGAGLGEGASFMSKRPDEEELVKKDLKEHPRMMHPSIVLGSGPGTILDVSERRMKDWAYNHGLDSLSGGSGVEEVYVAEANRRGLAAVSAMGLGLANTALKGYIPHEVLPSEAAIPTIDSLNNTPPKGWFTSNK